MSSGGDEQDGRTLVIASESGNLDFYGFALINTFVDDTADMTTLTDYTDEVKDFTNIVDTLVVEPHQNILELIKHNYELDLITLIHCSELFYKLDEDGSYAIRKDYKERYEMFYSTNELALHPVIMYFGEEPLHNGLSNDDIATVAEYIKSMDNGIKTMVVEAAPEVQNLNLSSYIDYVGFDHYFVFDPSENDRFMSNLSYLEKHLMEHQKIVMIMDTHFIERYHYEHGGIELEQMDEVANNYYNLARSHEDVVGLLGYFWPSGFDHKTSIGARNMPDDILQVYKSIGLNIIQDKE